MVMVSIYCESYSNKRASHLDYNNNNSKNTIKNVEWSISFIKGNWAFASFKDF